MMTNEYLLEQGFILVNIHDLKAERVVNLSNYKYWLQRLKVINNLIEYT